jgi:hypothetical protein
VGALTAGKTDPCASLSRALARRSLRPHLNQIRSWVRQGRTDAWIAHQLEVTVQQITSFKREQDLVPDEEQAEATPGADFDDEIDLRAEDDAAIAAELDAAEAKRQEEDAAAEAAGSDDDSEEGEEGEAKPRRRRSRRGGRSRGGRSANGAAIEGTFDHGEEGYGLWLDPAVADNAVYAEHWAGHRPVEVTIEEDRIVIRRAGADGSDDSDE